jgi:hypothetical protein
MTRAKNEPLVLAQSKLRALMVAWLHAYVLKDSLIENLVLLSMALPKWQYLTFINENQPAKNDPPIDIFSLTKAPYY